MTAPLPDTRARPRIGILSFSSGEYDARSFRIARSAIDAGYDVTIYTRWHRGLAPVEQRDGYRLVRAPYDPRFAVPMLRRRARRDARRAMAESAVVFSDDAGSSGESPGDGPVDDRPDAARRRKDQ